MFVEEDLIMYVVFKNHLSSLICLKGFCFSGTAMGIKTVIFQAVFLMSVIVKYFIYPTKLE